MATETQLLPASLRAPHELIRTVHTDKQRVPIVGHIITDDDIGAVVGAKLQHLNLNRVVKILTDPHSALLFDRHQHALKKVIKHYQNGFVLKDLVSVFKILNVCADRVEEHPLYIEPMIELLQLLRLPFLKEKSSDELNYRQIAIESASQLGYLMRVPSNEVRCQICTTISDFCFKRPPVKVIEGHKANTLEYNQKIVAQSDIAETLIKSLALLENDLDVKGAVLGVLQLLSANSEAMCSQMLQAEAAQRLCSRLMDYDPSGQILFRSVDVLWNLLQKGDSEVAAAQLNNLACISHLRDAFIHQLTQGYSHYDRQLRNDLLVLASLVASASLQAPFVETGFAKQLVLFATFQEVKSHSALVRHLKLLQNHEDFELKKLLIGILIVLSRDPCVIPILSEGKLLLALFSYVKANEKTVPSGEWTPAQFEEIQLHALTALCTLGPLMVDDYMMCQGSTRLLLMLEWCFSADDYGGTGNGFHGTGGRKNKRAQMRHCLRLIRSMVSTGEETILQDFTDQGAIHQITNTLSSMQTRERPPQDAVETEMQCDMLLILSALCENDAHRKELFGLQGVDVVIAYLKTDTSLLTMGQGHHQLILAAVDSVWCCVVGCYMTEDYFLEQEGIFLLIDLLESCPKSMHNQMFGCLLDLSENSKTVPHILAWRGKRDISAANLFCTMWRDEEASIRAHRDANGALSDTRRPLIGQFQEDQGITSLPASCPSQAIVDVSENMRAKMYSMFCKIGFIELPGLTTKDHVTLTIIEHYLDFKLGEVWTEVIAELEQDKVRPTTPDREALEAISRTVEDRAEHVGLVQRELLEAQTQQDLLEEQAHYAEIRENHRQKEKAIQNFNDYVLRTSNYMVLKAAKEKQELSIDASRVQTNYKAQDNFHSGELINLSVTKTAVKSDENQVTTCKLCVVSDKAVTKKNLCSVIRQRSIFNGSRRAIAALSAPVSDFTAASASLHRVHELQWPSSFHLTHFPEHQGSMERSVDMVTMAMGGVGSTGEISRLSDVEDNATDEMYTQRGISLDSLDSRTTPYSSSEDRATSSYLSGMSWLMDDDYSPEIVDDVMWDEDDVTSMAAEAGSSSATSSDKSSAREVWGEFRSEISSRRLMSVTSTTSETREDCDGCCGLNRDNNRNTVSRQRKCNNTHSRSNTNNSNEGMMPHSQVRDKDLSERNGLNAGPHQDKECHSESYRKTTKHAVDGGPVWTSKTKDYTGLKRNKYRRTGLNKDGSGALTHDRDIANLSNSRCVVLSENKADEYGRRRRFSQKEVPRRSKTTLSPRIDWRNNGNLRPIGALCRRGQGHYAGVVAPRDGYGFFSSHAKYKDGPQLTTPAQRDMEDEAIETNVNNNNDSGSAMEEVDYRANSIVEVISLVLYKEQCLVTRIYRETKTHSIEECESLPVGHDLWEERDTFDQREQAAELDIIANCNNNNNKKRRSKQLLRSAKAGRCPPLRDNIPRTTDSRVTRTTVVLSRNRCKEGRGVDCKLQGVFSGGGACKALSKAPRYNRTMTNDDFAAGSSILRRRRGLRCKPSDVGKNLDDTTVPQLPTLGEDLIVMRGGLEEKIFAAARNGVKLPALSVEGSNTQIDDAHKKNAQGLSGLPVLMFQDMIQSKDYAEQLKRLDLDIDGGEQPADTLMKRSAFEEMALGRPAMRGANGLANIEVCYEKNEIDTVCRSKSCAVQGNQRVLDPSRYIEGALVKSLRSAPSRHDKESTARTMHLSNPPCNLGYLRQMVNPSTIENGTMGNPEEPHDGNPYIINQAVMGLDSDGVDKENLQMTNAAIEHCETDVLIGPKGDAACNIMAIETVAMENQNIGPCIIDDFTEQAGTDDLERSDECMADCVAATRDRTTAEYGEDFVPDMGVLTAEEYIGEQRNGNDKAVVELMEDRPGEEQRDEQQEEKNGDRHKQAEAQEGRREVEHGCPTVSVTSCIPHRQRPETDQSPANQQADNELENNVCEENLNGLGDDNLPSSDGEIHEELPLLEAVLVSELQKLEEKIRRSLAELLVNCDGCKPKHDTRNVQSQHPIDEGDSGDGEVTFFDGIYSEKNRRKRLCNVTYLSTASWGCSHSGNGKVQSEVTPGVNLPCLRRTTDHWDRYLEPFRPRQTTCGLAMELLVTASPAPLNHVTRAANGKRGVARRPTQKPACRARVDCLPPLPSKEASAAEHWVVTVGNSAGEMTRNLVPLPLVSPTVNHPLSSEIPGSWSPPCFGMIRQSGEHHHTLGAAAVV